MIQQKKISVDMIANALKSKGYRRTSGRIALLELLLQEGRPLNVREILERSKTLPLDQATLYRALEDLSHTGIVSRVDLNTGTARYEYTPKRPHHHHLVCTKCKTVEDVELCAVSALQEKVLKDSGNFKSIYSHNLEFFGMCNRCSKA